MKQLFVAWTKLSLVLRISIGMVVGILLGVLSNNVFPEGALSFIGMFGTVFVSALKAVAPILVLFLVVFALAQHQKGQKTNMRMVITLYAVGTLLAAVTSVIMSFLFPVTLDLKEGVTDVIPPDGITEVLTNLLLNIVSNPIHALANANYVGILAWGVALGIALRHASSGTKQVIGDASDALSRVVKWVINLAPLGIMGLVYAAVAEGGIAALKSYGNLLLVLIGTMLLIALVINPIIVFVVLRKNPYPLVFRCLKDSGLTAFFTRSSAANIPVNMTLCESLELDPDTYSISIPLGATINMAGAAVTITVLSLAAVHTLGLPVDIPTALLLSVMAAVSACGTSGVAGGSLLLIPLACSLFGIQNDIAMQVVAIGFVIGILQDSAETALNSSTDVLFTATADFAKRNKFAS